MLCKGDSELTGSSWISIHYQYKIDVGWCGYSIISSACLSSCIVNCGTCDSDNSAAIIEVNVTCNRSAGKL